jgi:hypothetical protein
LADEYKFWNREESTSGQAQMVLDMSPESIQKEARILCLAADDDEANMPLTSGKLPFGSRLLHVGSQSTDFADELASESPNGTCNFCVGLLQLYGCFVPSNSLLFSFIRESELSTCSLDSTIGLSQVPNN